jgi:hypothetical protein
LIEACSRSIFSILSLTDYSNLGSMTAIEF